MSRALLFTINFHDGRYHGVPDWPPSPARLFQALIAGAARGDALDAVHLLALEWLEGLDPPALAAPPARLGRALTSYVPNNDLDSVGRDPKRVGEIRAAKLIRPQIFDAAIPLLYHWTFAPSPEAEVHAMQICTIAERLYQLGRGVDMAWAVGEVLDADEAEARLRGHRGPILRPTRRGAAGTGGVALPCPAQGSLDSLIARHKANRSRFSEIREAAPTAKDPQRTKVTGTTFRQPPKPRFQQVAYDCPPTFLLFDLRDRKGDFFAWPLARIVELATVIRDGAAQKLKGAYEEAQRSDLAATVEPVFIGRNAAEADKTARIRIVPLPSIGSPHVIRAVRRVLVAVPPNCPISPDEIAWAFSGLGLETIDAETGEISAAWRLTPAEDRKMLSHYGVETKQSATVWRSVTPLALPDTARRRRIDPARIGEEKKPASERDREEKNAAAAVAAALRHAGCDTPATVTAVRREPFQAREARAEAFAPGTRFAKESLWHAEVRFAAPIAGPLVLGDGRYCGLGVMHPVQEVSGIWTVEIVEGLVGAPDYELLTRALRRALMARVQQMLKAERLPIFFSGHEVDGAPARSGSHRHLAFAFDGRRNRFLIIAPHILERREPFTSEVEFLSFVTRALVDFGELRAGAAGRLALAPVVAANDDPLIGPSKDWASLTPYQANRHLRRADASTTVEADLKRSLLEVGLPAPEIMIESIVGGKGIQAHARLRFPAHVEGLMLFGRTRHFGGGLFCPTTALIDPTTPTAK